MRLLVFHGYLLRGTGSNVYNASLARALVALGHEVHLLCQDRAAAQLPFVDAVGEWERGELRLRAVREPVRCTAYLPPIGDLLPVYVADAYEGFRAVPFPDLSGAELESYIDANVAAVRAVADRIEPHAALANHLVAGPAILARALDGRVPYAVKIHGSALEYTVRPHRARFLALASEGLDAASGVLVGSAHTAASLWEVMADPELPARTRLGPPGVDVEAFRPRPADEAAERLRALAGRLEAGGTAAWGGDAGAAAALRRLDPASGAMVGFVGKLIVSKGVDLLAAAWPLVVDRMPAARLCLVGFGTFRAGLLSLIEALAAGDLAGAGRIASRGRELEGGPPGPLRHLGSFLERVEDDALRPPFAGADYRRAARLAMERVHLTGRLEHSDLPDLLPAFAAQVMPSTFPEAFGMVAAEAACCAALPVSAAHSGLAEVTATLSQPLPPRLRRLLSFPVDDQAVEALAERLCTWLELPADERFEAARALSETARSRYGWKGVAEGVIAAAEGRLDALAAPVLPAAE